MDEKTINEFLFSTDKNKLQVNVIYNYLSKESYWAQNIPLEIVKQSIEGSICFGVYYKDQQIGYARVVTDCATFGYLADVFILQPFRGKGLSKQLMQFIMDNPAFKKIRRFMLATKDAQGLYKQFGFSQLAMPERIMEIKFFETY
ncbi:MAG: GNAT family N-acetyltransferase [Bacteroidia bacterium]